MKPNYAEAYNLLKVMGVPVFEREDEPGRFLISAEHAESGNWVDYWAEGPAYRDWAFGVNPTLDAVLDRFGLFAEWENPGCLVVCES